MLKSLPGILVDIALPKYLFITGDLRYGKNCLDGFPEEIVNDIKKFMENCMILPEHVHIVMGNHDAIRDLGREDIAPLLRNDYAKNEILDDRRMRILELTQHGFYEIYRSICNREPAPYHKLVVEPDFNIICLNTALA